MSYLSTCVMAVPVEIGISARLVKGARRWSPPPKFPQQRTCPDGPPKPIPNGGLAGPASSLGGESPSADFALYGCSTGHDYYDGMIHTTNTRNLTVLSVPAGKSVLTIPLPHNLVPYPATLANANSHTWLLLLRDGIKLETYKLP